MAEPGREKAMTQITYYGHHNRETGGPILEKHVKQNVDIDVTVTSGAHTGTASSFKAKKIPADLRWLLQEGMEVPVFVDQSGNATALDMEGLAPWYRPTRTRSMPPTRSGSRTHSTFPRARS